MHAVVICAALMLGVQATDARVLPGIDNLLLTHASLVAGKRVGVVTNHTGFTADGVRTIDALHGITGVTLVAIFTPEHGLNGTVGAGGSVASSTDSATGAPVISLYGALRKPKKEMLKDLDVIVYDIQDVGIRSYTYISTLGLVMEAAGEAGVKMIVLDRPGLLATRVDGNVLDTAWRSFVGKYPIPYVYGMTVGELATMINREGMTAKRCQLTVVPMTGWSRAMTWEATGLNWRPTSPNIPTPSTATYCAAFGALGELGAGYQGIGSANAFRVFGGAKFPARMVDSALTALHLPGVRSVVGDTVIVTKTGAPMPIQLIRFELQRDSVVDLFAIGLQLLSILHRMHLLKWPDSAHIAMFNKVCGGRMFEQITSGADVATILPRGTAAPATLIAYMRTREKYLLYH